KRQPRQPLEGSQAGDLVARKVEGLEVLQLLQGGKVTDLVVGQVQQREVLALFQAGQVGDFLALGLQDEDVGGQLGFREVALGVVQGGAQGRLQVFVGDF